MPEETKANLTSVLRLPYLSPVIVEKVLSGELADASVRRVRMILLNPYCVLEIKPVNIGNTHWLNYNYTLMR